MAPLLLNVSSALTESSKILPEGAKMSLSDMKFGEEATRAYPFKWISVTTADGQFHPGLRFVFTSDESAMDITFSNGNGSILCRLADSNVQVNHVVAMLEAEIKKGLGPTEAHLLAPLKKQPTSYQYDPALSVKTRKTAIDTTQSSPNAELARGHTLTRYVITVQRINFYKGTYYAGLNLTACVIQPSTKRVGGSSACGGETDSDFFDMMAVSEVST